MKKFLRHIGALLVVMLLLTTISACSSPSSSEPAISDSNEVAVDGIATQTIAAPTATDTPAPTATTPPTDTPVPTETPAPTDTPTPTPEPTATDTPEPTDTPTPTNTPMPDIIVVAASLNLRTGPGLAYASAGSLVAGDTATVIGQAYDCGWLLVETAGGEEAWITGDAQYVTLNRECAEIAVATIPPTPTTAAPATVNVVIENFTIGPLSMNLNGPGVYNLTIQTGNHTIQIVPGTYNYTVTGCGGTTVTGSVQLASGDYWAWFCAFPSGMLNTVR